MTNTTTFMNEFMEKLKSDGFVKENQPNKGPDITKEFIEQQIESYSQLIKSDVFKRAIK